MSLSPIAQCRVQACGSSILSLMQHDPNLEYDFNNCFFSDSGAEKQKYQCLTCGVKLENMLSCATCHAVSYCSVSCQRTDWKSRHRYECQAMKRAYDGLKGVCKI